MEEYPNQRAQTILILDQSSKFENLYKNVQVKQSIDKTRHVSMISRCQLNNRISQIQKKINTNVLMQGILDTISGQELFHKVYAFINRIIQNKAENVAVLSVFQNRNGVKNYKTASNDSVQSIQQKDKSESDIQTRSEDKIFHLKQITNQSPLNSQNTVNPSSLKTNRGSLMSKSNRISLVDAINSQQIKKQFSTNTIQQSNSQHSLDLHQQSSNKMMVCQFQKKSLNSITSEEVIKRTQKRMNTMDRGKKISIMMDDDFQIQSNTSSEQQCLPTLMDINIPTFHFNPNIIQIIYESPAPFLINLSLCLLCKLLHISKHQLTKDNAVWLMTISTLISYKLYYDEPISDLSYIFSEILGTETGIISNLQVWFLNKMNYEVNIDNCEYYSILSKWALC